MDGRSWQKPNFVLGTRQGTLLYTALSIRIREDRAYFFCFVFAVMVPVSLNFRP